jgi:hypothetical protein
MTLPELEPCWWWFESGGPRVGLTFLCPHCKTVRLGVAFHHAGHEAIEDQYIKAHDGSNRFIWTEDGNDFATVTLSPSIDASHSGHWHGSVIAGRIV